MKRSALCSLCCLLTLTVAASDDLRTLKGFESAFRRAHDDGSIRRLESLVCWDRATSKEKSDMRSALRAGLSDRIHRIEIVPFYTAPLDATVEPMHRFQPVHDPNLELVYVLFVWYDLGNFLGMRYLVGKKNGRFYFAVARDWDAWIRAPMTFGSPRGLTNRCS